jgi:hypothetical protein
MLRKTTAELTGDGAVIIPTADHTLEPINGASKEILGNLVRRDLAKLILYMKFVFDILCFRVIEY